VLYGGRHESDVDFAVSDTVDRDINISHHNADLDRRKALMKLVNKMGQRPVTKGCRDGNREAA
jgi:hypothetical protein